MVPEIVISVDDDTIEVGETIQLTVIATYPDGTVVDITDQVTWTSSAEDVVTIGEDGVASGLAEGTAEITATFDGVTSEPVTLTIAGTAVQVSWWIILAIILSLLGAGSLYYYLNRRGAEAPSV